MARRQPRVVSRVSPDAPPHLMVRRDAFYSCRDAPCSFRAILWCPWFYVLRATTLACFVLSSGLPASAHPISLTESVVDVQKDRVDVELKVLVEDLVLYYPVSADEQDVYPAEDLQKAAQRHRQFVTDGLQLLDQDGHRLSAKIVQIDASQIDHNGVALTDIKQVAISYFIRSMTDRPLEFLTVSQSFGGEKAILPAMMDCQVKQQGVVLDVPQPLLSGQTLTTKFDWTKPPTPPRNWRELKQRRDERLKQQLGIASYSGLYSFIYITPHEVRHEILIPLLTLDQWVPGKRSDPAFLEVAEQEIATEKIVEFFQRGNPVSINGSDVSPKVSRVNFFGLDIRDFAMNAAPRRVSVAQARVGIMLNYPAKSFPKKIRIQWETYNQFAPFLKSTIYPFDKPAIEHFFRPDEPTWRYVVSPSAPTAGRPSHSIASNGRTPTSEEADEISVSLLRNVYRAFDFHDEQETYRALAESVEGPLLRSLYLQIRRSLLMAEQGGSRSRVLNVRPVSGKFIGKPSSARFEIDFTWRVLSDVEHWGHIHTRENEYLGRLSVSDTGGILRLRALKFVNQKRVRFQTRLRK